MSEETPMSERLIDKYMIAAEAARQLDINSQTLMRIAKSGKIRYRKIGRRNYFATQDLVNYLDSTAVASNAPESVPEISLNHLGD